MNEGIVLPKIVIPPDARAAIIMGSRNDWPGTMDGAAKILDLFGVPYHVYVVSAHRTHDLVKPYAEAAEASNIEAIIAGAGGAAHLAGGMAACTWKPVFGVPVKSSALSGIDSVLSILQMPDGIPVSTLAIGKAGLAALAAVSNMSVHDPELRAKYIEFRRQQTQKVLDNPDPRIPEKA